MAGSALRALRLACLGALAFGVASGSASAQAAGADTTAAWRYYPLEVGNVWEYENPNGPYPSTFYQRRIVGDTTVQGRRYFVREWRSTAAPSAPPSRDYVRFDTVTATPRSLLLPATGPPSEDVIGCALDTTVGEALDCSDAFGSGTLVSHEVAPVVIGRRGAETPADTVRTVVKWYEVGLGFYVEYGADLGLLSEGGEGYDAWLTYARIGGVEYGASRFPTAVATRPRGLMTLHVDPNPARGRAALVLDAQTPGTARVEVVDLLGRRVLTVERPLGAGRQSLALDVGGLAPGPYVVRVEAGGEVGTARLTVVR